MSKNLKIVSISAEIHPFSKSGGLADVARSLPKALARLGHEVISITPLYGRVIDKEKHELKKIYSNVEIYLNSKDKLKVNYWKGYAMHGLPVYFVECKKYFSQRKSLYGSSHENARFMVFNVAALKLISLLKFKADIVQCHDWQTGLIPFYLKTDFRYSKTLSHAKTIFTIHNLIFQFGKNWWEVDPSNKDFGRKRLPHLNDPQLEYINFAKRAILSADAISTVSENYRDEIMTRKFGQDLHRILRNRKERLFGIVNGISYEACNPAKDDSLKMKYDFENMLEAKAQNKAYIQKKFGLPLEPNVPIICTTSRITFQKGFDLITNIIDQLARLDMQMIIIGSGDKTFIKPLKKAARKFPKKLVVIPSHTQNQKYETLIFAGSDFFLLPSHYEPCGINQLKAMRYGCVPIVRKVGGLYDTVWDYNPGTGKGTGFTFVRYDKYSLYSTIIRSLEAYRYPSVWKDIAGRCMLESNSWEIPAKKYVKLYRKVIRMNPPKLKLRRTSGGK